MATSGANKEKRVGETEGSDLSKIINQTTLGCTMITVCVCVTEIERELLMILYTVARGLDNN